MKAGTRSRTAEVAAFQRAAHLLVDDSPKIFVDDKVLPLLSLPARLLLRAPAHLARRLARGTRSAAKNIGQLRGQIIVRSRYTEDQLEKRIAAGVSQYVILSAGLDTFALRRTDLADQLRVYEVDQIDTQRWKLAQLSRPTPRNVRFIPVDFENQSIADALRDSDYNPDEPAFFSWLGTTYYLTREAIRSALSTLRCVAASGSELVLDYWSSEPDMDWQDQFLLSGIRLAVALQREPMLSFFDSDQIEREVEDLGYEVVDNLSPEELRAHYLANRKDNLSLPGFAYLLRIRVR